MTAKTQKISGLYMANIKRLVEYSGLNRRAYF